MRYKANHIRRLRDEATARYEAIVRALGVSSFCGSDTIVVDGSETRMAVDDFKSVLSEIRRLK